LVAVDAAGNSTPVAERRRIRVRIRYIDLASKRIVVSGRRADSRSESRPTRTRYTWKLGGRKSRSQPARSCV